MLRHSIVMLAIAMPVLPGIAHEVALANLKIVHPWTKEPAAGVERLPVYMTIRNTGPETERILAASSPLARKAQLVGAVATGAETVIEIPPGASIKLGRDGPHIELIDLTEPLTGYEMFPLWLTLEKAGRVEVEVMVEENDDTMTGHTAPAAPSPAKDGDPPTAPHEHHQDGKQESKK